MKRLLAYTSAEIKSWLRNGLMQYRYELPVEQHRKIIKNVWLHLHHELENKNETQRLAARTLAHYLAQQGLRPWYSILLLEIVSFFILLPIIIYWLVKGYSQQKTSHTSRLLVRWNKSPFRYKNNPSIYHTPVELSEIPAEVFSADSIYLRIRDIHFLLSTAAYLFSLKKIGIFQLLFKITKEIAWARAMLDYYPAQQILIDGEFDCALSILTSYVHRHGKHLYNVMHGDKFISALDTFFEVDRCYCWNTFYIEQFTAQYAKADFRIYENPAFQKNPEDDVAAEGIGVILPIAYFIEDQKQIKAFAHTLNQLSEKFSVHIRHHPMLSKEISSLKPFINEKIIFCAPTDEPLKKFILRHELLFCSGSSTLAESVMLGRKTFAIKCSYVDNVVSHHYILNLPNAEIVSIEKLYEESCAWLNAS